MGPYAAIYVSQAVAAESQICRSKDLICKVLLSAELYVPLLLWRGSLFVDLRDGASELNDSLCAGLPRSSICVMPLGRILYIQTESLQESFEMQDALSKINYKSERLV